MDFWLLLEWKWFRRSLDCALTFTLMKITFHLKQTLFSFTLNGTSFKKQNIHPYIITTLLFYCYKWKNYPPLIAQQKKGEKVQKNCCYLKDFDWQCRMKYKTEGGTKDVTNWGRWYFCTETIWPVLGGWWKDMYKRRCLDWYLHACTIKISRFHPVCLRWSNSSRFFILIE